MSKPKLPSSLMPPAEATDQQIAIYTLELCGEIRAALNNPLSGDIESLKTKLDLIEAEAQMIIEKIDRGNG